MANTTIQPTLQDDTSTAKILAKIKQLETNMARLYIRMGLFECDERLTGHLLQNAKNRLATSQRKDQLLIELNQEYERLARKRLDQCNSLMLDWQSYQQDQKKTRQSDIVKRQIEFDRQLDVLDEEKRRNWVSHTQNISEISNQLLHYLKHYSTDSSILTFPTNVLDQFWVLQIQIPVLQAELPLTIDALNQLLSKDQVES